MRSFIALFTVLFTLGMAQVVSAGCPTVVSPTTAYQCTTSVFNDSGGAFTSGEVVVWDNDDTEWDRSGFPQVTTTTTADFPHTAGVIVNGTCPDQAMCEMVYFGWARTNIAHNTTAATEDNLVGTSTVAGQAGDYTAGTADDCALGHLLELFNLDTQAAVPGTDNQDLVPMPVWVNIHCE